MLAPAWAAESRSRGVTILDAPTLGPATSAPSSGAGGMIFTPPPGLTGRLAPEPAQNALGGEAGEGVPPRPANTVEPGTRVQGANAAELTIEISPGADIPLGTKVVFRVSTKKEGYLLLLDIDADGKLTQIYPNPMSVVAATVDPQNSNRVKPGKTVLIPNPTDEFAGFEFVASPPQGTALVVALLSDRPVQMIDLPDVPANLLGQAQAVTYLANLTNELRIPNPESGQLQEARWSVDARFYSVR